MASASSATSTTRPSTPFFNRNTSRTAYPSKTELLNALPAELTRFNPTKAWGSLIMSAGLSLAALGIGSQIPLTLLATPLWALYGIGCGTIAMGCWVLAHECGHNAFHPNRRIEGVVGFLLHSTLTRTFLTFPIQRGVGQWEHCKRLTAPMAPYSIFCTWHRFNPCLPPCELRHSSLQRLEGYRFTQTTIP